MSALCPVCSTGDESIEFPTVRALFEHEQSGHVSRPEKKLPLPRKPVTPSATEKNVSSLPDTQVKSKEGNVNEVSIVKPLELHYRWVGVHAACNSEPKTIEVIIDEEHVAAVAFCVSCNLQLQQKIVVKIPEDNKKK